jgi:hypothetical protein
MYSYTPHTAHAIPLQSGKSGDSERLGGNQKVDDTTKISIYFGQKVDIPVRNYWSRRAMSRFLKQQGLTGSDVNTLDHWEWDKKLWRTIPDFRNEIPKDVNGKYIKGFRFTSYQAWVVIKTSFVITQLRDDLMGTAYLEELATAIANPKIQQQFLSRAVWLWELNQAA